MGALILWLTVGAQPAWAADPVLALSPTEGASSSSFSATYTDTPPPRTVCSPGSVDFWWDAAAPGSGNPAATKLGSAEIQVSGCTAVAPGLVVPEAPCGRHVVYAFRSRNGDPELGTTASAAFTVTCPTPTPTPAPPAPTPAPTPAATPTPAGKPSAGPSAIPSAPPSESPSASGSPSPSPSPSATPSPSSSPPPPPPPPGPQPPGPDWAGILALILLGLLPLGGWAASTIFKLGPIGRGGSLKWLSLVLAVLLGGGLAWIGSLNFGLKSVLKTVQFDYAAGAQSWTVPAGVEQATFTVWGAEGGGACPTSPGGLGGKAIATIPVTPGEVLEIRVGGKGKFGTCNFGPNPNAAGGYNGGAAGGGGSASGGGGGGASDVRHAPYLLADRWVVAGGGGGAAVGDSAPGFDASKGGPGEDVVGAGGGGGGTNGQNGDGGSGQAGVGGTQITGGGDWNGGGGGGEGEGEDGGAGTFGVGGAGGNGGGTGGMGGGGGGGGWNGGGGGGVDAILGFTGGGGGGSGHGPADVYFLTGVWFGGDGSVLITYIQHVSIFVLYP